MKKFTLRDLFFVTPLVAMACGWWVDHRRMESRNRELNAAIRELGQAMEAQPAVKKIQRTAFSSMSM
jgi:hypothetical protein